MGYLVECSSCKEKMWASNIVELINDHTEINWKIKCVACGSHDASIYQKSNLQEKGETWERYIKGVIPIKTDYDTYTPYMFLTAQTTNGEIDGIHFNYFKDTRKNGGRLKHGHGPGGAPVFSKSELFQLLDNLIKHGCLSKHDLMEFTKKI